MSTRTAEEIWRSPIVSALATGLGVLLILAAIGLLFWMENRAINTARSLEQGAAIAKTVPSDRVDPANDGKLVHLTGEATAGDMVTDPDFNLSVKALRLAREVEVYQWKESKKETKKNDKTVVTYQYTQVWSRDKPPQNFEQPEGHTNPPDKPYADSTFNAREIKVGAFTLSPSQVNQVPVNETLTVSNDLLAKVPEDLKGRTRPDPDGRLFVGAQPGDTPETPQAGDARIRYKVANPQPITIVAQQTGNTFAPYQAEAGDQIDLLKPGTHSARELFESAQSSNRLVNWVVRVGGFVLLTLGIFLVLCRQILALSGSAPESLSRAIGAALFAVGAALAVVLVVIGARWLLYQPGTGGGLLAIGVLLLAGMVGLTLSQKTGLFANLLGGVKKWSPQERDYFRRVALDPENPELRLELARLLEKNRDPMGEFIRITQELDTLPREDERRERLDKRWSELLRTYGWTWFAPLGKLHLVPRIADIFYPGLWIHNGIIDKVVVNRPGILPEKADQLFAAVPGLRVLELHQNRIEQGLGGQKLLDWKPDLPAIVRLPQLKQIGALDLSSLGLTVDDVRAIASAPNLENLTELDISSNKVGPEGAVLLLQSPVLKRLRVLELRYCNIGDEGAVALAGSSNLDHLVELQLASNEITRRGAGALASSAHLKNLRKLDLSGNKIGPLGAQAVADSPHFRQLTDLDLRGAEMGSEAALALARSANLVGVKTLKLPWNRLGGTGLSFLAQSPHLGQLEVLDLDNNEIDDEGVAALTRSQTIQQLKELLLGGNKISDAGFTALAGWSGLARLTTLILSENKAGAAGIQALAASPYLRGLEVLNVSKIDMGLAGARALADSPVLTNIKYLHVQESKLNLEAEHLLRKRFGDAVYLK